MNLVSGLWPLASVWPLTCLCGFPSGLLYVLLRLVAEFNLQLLGLHLQILLSVCQGFTGLCQTDMRHTPSRMCERRNNESFSVILRFTVSTSINKSHHSLFMLAADIRAQILVSSFNLFLIHIIESFLLFCAQAPHQGHGAIVFER